MDTDKTSKTQLFDKLQKIAKLSDLQLFLKKKKPVLLNVILSIFKVHLLGVGGGEEI